MIMIKKYVKKNIDNLLFNSRKIGLIVSTGRTGTKFINGLLAESDSVLSVHELNRRDQEFSFACHKNKISENQFIDYYRSSRRNLIIKNLNKLLIESNGNLILSTHELINNIKNLRVALIIRDPRDVIKSACNRSFTDKNGVIRKTYEMEKNWQFKAYEVDNFISKEQWMEMSMPVRFMWTWTYRNQYVLKLAEKSDDIEVFRFEDIFSDSNKMNELVKFISYKKVNLSNEQIDKRFSIKVNANKIEDFPSFENWDEKLKQELKKYCGDLMEKYNYR